MGSAITPICDLDWSPQSLLLESAICVSRNAISFRHCCLLPEFHFTLLFVRHKVREHSRGRGWKESEIQTDQREMHSKLPHQLNVAAIC